MKQEIVALGKYVTIKKFAIDQREVDGIIVPETNQSLMSRAMVISVGEQVEIGIKPGDIIIYNEIENNAFTDESVEDKEIYMIDYKLIYSRYKRDNE